MYLVRFLFLLGCSGFALAEAEAAAQPSPMNHVMLFVILFAVIYFLMIRPQNKKAKEHKKLLSNLESGDEVITAGGLLGTISKVTEQFFIVNLGAGFEVPVQKNAISQAIPKGTIKSL